MVAVDIDVDQTSVVLANLGQEILWREQMLLSLEVSADESLGHRCSVPVHVENEAHAGAIVAHYFGPRPGARNLVYLSVGVGLGAGVFVDGVLVCGKRGFAGQVGHTHFVGNGV